MTRRLGIQTLALISAFALASPALAAGIFTAHLNGARQVPPFDTLAQGQFVARQPNSGGLSYKLIVSNLSNVVAAHIHCGAEGVNGPVGVTLFLGSPVTINGILAQGPIVTPDPGNACGWVDLDDVIDALESGDTYINVHTLQSLPGEYLAAMFPRPSPMVSVVCSMSW